MNFVLSNILKDLKWTYSALFTVNGPNLLDMQQRIGIMRQWAWNLPLAYDGPCQMELLPCMCPCARSRSRCTLSGLPSVPLLFVPWVGTDSISTSLFPIYCQTPESCHQSQLDCSIIWWVYNIIVVPTPSDPKETNLEPNMTHSNTMNMDKGI